MVWEVRNTSDQTAVQSIDKYEESVDFQNNCRSYYLNRVEASESFKRKLEQNREKPKQTSMSAAMERLRQEMTSLVDQDLSLMRQLLTLNETIEELKNKRLYGVSKDSLGESTNYLKDSSRQLDKSMSSLSLSSQTSSECSSSIMSEDDTEIKELDS
ncbi:uncharacterized protein LOC127730717 [Mytilus californianus]|uniref:uncharacterized protein LOC127730717 n=1 Tax=Mytilus californianus TaxID=6549 RepID=UPI0022474AA1|nr:uncharacterized protein LOC127730717 [Mytilus californianus]